MAVVEAIHFPILTQLSPRQYKSALVPLGWTSQPPPQIDPCHLLFRDYTRGHEG
jgi:hypothetical protein